jgi:hypothetical protein
MLEELNIMKLNFEVKHRLDFSGTLILRVTDSLCNSGAFNNPNAVRDCPFNLKEFKRHGFYPGVGSFFRMQRYCF